jgi:chaperone BCS1
MPSFPSSLIRRLSTALASDLGGQTDLAELTYALVLRNFLTKIRECSTRLDLLLKIVVPWAILLGGIYGTLRQVGTLGGIVPYLWNSATALLSSKITVPANHSLNASILAWLASRGLAKNARELALADLRSTYIDCEDSETDQSDDANVHATPQSLSVIPDFGKYRFRYKGHFMSMERKNDGTKDDRGRPIASLDPTLPQNLALECFPTLRGTAPILEFLQEVKRASTPTYIPSVAVVMTTVHRAREINRRWDGDDDGDGQWVQAITRPARSIESVALETSKKDALVADITYYLTPECERFYANRGYPYRRGFLLYGPPGTGKTSFCLALAGHFNLDLYILSLNNPGISDHRLDALFDDLPQRCILLLEDVDSAGLEREKSKEELKKLSRKEMDFAHRNSGRQTTLTLSGLLNCLDGPTSKDGRIVCMTSNAPDSLDPALIRPGRCDQKVLFGYANQEICTKLFEHLYTKTPDELVEGETSASAQYDIAQMAEAFASAIPSGGRISPAEVQGYLMIHRRDPVAAVEGAEAFAKDIIEVKARDKNVAEHANEIEKSGQNADETDGSEESGEDESENDEQVEHSESASSTNSGFFEKLASVWSGSD